MAEMVSRIDPKVLKVHPRNAEFFDDVDGAEFDRLVESIKDHGVLTPLRVTKDMTIISGHQRVRAAIKAGCSDVPVIFDESDDENDVLMKLIETNFGRMKNDPIKQAKWLDEYLKLRGVRQGSARQKVDSNNWSQITQSDIAKELGISVSQLNNMKSLLKLDPAFQALISEGKISATTGFKVIARLSPEDQTKVYGKLPTDVKLSDKAVRAYVEELQQKADEDRQRAVNNTNKAMEENSRLMGEKEQLQRENNELRAGVLPVSKATQEKIDTLEEEKRKYYEEANRLKKETERLRGEIDKVLSAKALAEAKANGGDDAVIALENRITELQNSLEAQERKANDLEFQLEEKADEIKELKRENKEGFMRKALRIDETPEELSQRERDALVSNIQIAIGQFQSKVEGALTQLDSFYSIDKPILKVLVETCSQAISAGTRLKVALMTASGFDDEVTGNEDYDLDDSGLELTLGA